jgi:hypothetical protein
MSRAALLARPIRRQPAVRATSVALQEVPPAVHRMQRLPAGQVPLPRAGPMRLHLAEPAPPLPVGQMPPLPVLPVPMPLPASARTARAVHPVLVILRPAQAQQAPRAEPMQRVLAVPQVLPERRAAWIRPELLALRVQAIALELRAPPARIPVHREPALRQAVQEPAPAAEASRVTRAIRPEWGRIAQRFFVSSPNVDRRHQSKQESGVKCNQGAPWACLQETRGSEPPVRGPDSGRRFLSACGSLPPWPVEENNEELPMRGGCCEKNRIQPAWADARRYAIPASIDVLHAVPATKIYNTLPTSLPERLPSGRSHPARGEVRSICTAG